MTKAGFSTETHIKKMKRTALRKFYYGGFMGSLKKVPFMYKIMRLNLPPPFSRIIIISVWEKAGLGVGLQSPPIF